MNGLIIIEAEETISLNCKVSFQMRASHLDKKDMFGKSDPYVLISKAATHKNDKNLNVDKHRKVKSSHKSAVSKLKGALAQRRARSASQRLDVDWSPLHSTMQRLCNGDDDRAMLFEVYDWNR